MIAWHLPVPRRWRPSRPYAVDLLAKIFAQFDTLIGIIGTTKFTYDLWGESVNLASRLESSGESGRIHV